MAEPIGSFSGLSTGIQWRDMVDQIMTNETSRLITPVTTRQTALTTQADAWKQLQTIVTKFRDAAAALRLASSFNVFSAVATKSPSTSRDLVAVSAGADAAPGIYSVDVLATARAEKISGAIVASNNTALGVTGSFILNGATINVSATDTLALLRDKINAANTGTQANGVSASILSTPTGVRMVLSADSTGASGIEAVDDLTGTLRTLGFVDATTASNVDVSGAAQTIRFSSSSSAIGTLMPVAVPAATSITVGGYAVSVDLSTDSLTSIAEKINTATGNASAARVVSTTQGGRTTYRLVTDLTVSTDAGAVAADSARALAVLGFTAAGRSNVAQTISSANVFTDAGTGIAATSATLLSDLEVNGQPFSLASGDTIEIAGTRGDGSTVRRTFSVGAGTTLDDLLAAINDSGTGFGAGTRTASGAISAGRITMTDGTAGDSQLGLVLKATHANGDVISLGAFSTANGGTAGRSRQIAAGSDALVSVDGQVVRRSTNTITDVIQGVTLTALIAEPGTSSQITIARDNNAIARAIQDVAAAYNSVRAFAQSASAAGGPLANNATLRSLTSNLTSQLLLPVVGTSGTFTSAVMGGLHHDKLGVLSLDVEAFTASLTSSFLDVRRLFTQSGTTTDAELSFLAATSKSKPTATGYDVNITQVASRAAVTGGTWTTYATSGTPDSMTITDAASGKSGSISLANGDSIASAVQRLNTMFSTNGMRLTATRTVDDRLEIMSLDYGTEGGFTVAYTPGDGDGTAQLGMAGQAYTGLDVQGTINGAAATGHGQVLTGGAEDASAGIAVLYTGTTVRAAGTVTFSLGVAGVLERVASTLSDGSATSIGAQEENARSTARKLDLRLSDLQARLDARKAALIQQFVAMEAAVSRSQSIGTWLASQVSALSANNQ